MIASDLDGTIVSSTGKISTRTRDAFLAAREAGIHIVFVTGRPYRWLTPIVDAFGGLGTVICSNGAVLYDLENDQVLWSRTIDAATAVEAQQIILHHEPQASFAAETTKGLHLGAGFAETGRTLGSLAELDLHSPELDAEGIVKFLARSPGLAVEAFYSAVFPELSRLLWLTHSATGVSLLEMAHLQIHKANTLDEYARRLQIKPAEIMAFGDMPNDIEMLQYAGHGYAMASGHRETLAATKLIAPPFAEDGVAQVIEGLLK
ncbi:HAD family hydrolase [Glutamicibacter sp. MNS18]|uniref:HAD family hydrolase n=1 Tax=Glutamicibacter sp. MNS18 TaxID=2989817 RepID=UPI00223593EC|nr:HAD family hydrolase [Glutamicibacter sp. MNS18]MCW4466673.1 HAD family hydrolase [Glutamicibacter sp. MNS18]